MGLDNEQTADLDMSQTDTGIELTPEGIEKYVEREEAANAKKASEPAPEADLEVGEAKTEGDGEKAAKEPQEAQKPADTAQAYQPDFLYNTVGGKKAEIPEQIRPLIKSKEDNDYWKGLLSKADGFDLVKEKGLQSQKLYEELAAPTAEFYKRLESKDLKGAFEIADIPVPSVTDLVTSFGMDPKALAQELIDYMDLTPEQKNLQNQQIETERRQQALEQREQQIALSERSHLQQQLKNDLNSAITQQGVAHIAAEFDRINGQEGSFLAEVVEHGHRAYEATGKWLPVETAVQHVIKRYGLDRIAQQAPVAQPAPVAPQRTAPPVVDNSSLPTIPALGDSHSGSPGEMEFNSIEDLKRYYQKTYGSGI